MRSSINYTAHSQIIFCKGSGLFGSYYKGTLNLRPMSNREIDNLRSAVRWHLTKYGSYSHVLINMYYADILQKELNCTEPQVAKCLDMKNLSIVDGLEKDFAIIP